MWEIFDIVLCGLLNQTETKNFWSQTSDLWRCVDVVVIVCTQQNFDFSSQLRYMPYDVVISLSNGGNFWQSLMKVMLVSMVPSTPGSWIFSVRALMRKSTSVAYCSSVYSHLWRPRFCLAHYWTFESLCIGDAVELHSTLNEATHPRKDSDTPKSSRHPLSSRVTHNSRVA